ALEASIQNYGSHIPSWWESSDDPLCGTVKCYVTGFGPFSPVYQGANEYFKINNLEYSKSSYGIPGVTFKRQQVREVQLSEKVETYKGIVARELYEYDATTGLLRSKQV